MAIWLVSGLLVATLYLLITEKIPVDLTAMGLMAILAATNIISPMEAVAGLANPAVVTVAAMFIVSRAMIRTGAVGFIGQRLIRHSRGRSWLALLATLVIVAVASAFINNTPVVVLFIPIITSLSCEYDLSPSKFLIPVSYASILAGTCTLIGTSTNIIVSDLSLLHGYGAIGMFELARLGLPIAFLGIGFLFFAAPRLMPGHAVPACELEDREHRRYLAEFTVTANSSLVGMDALRDMGREFPTVEVFEVVRGEQIMYPDREQVRLQPGDLLLVKAAPADLMTLLNSGHVEVPHLTDRPHFVPGDSGSVLAELIIPPQSSLIGEPLLDSGLHRDPDIHVLAVKRRRLHYSAQKIQRAPLRTGDILLVQCPEGKLEELRGNPDFIVVEDVHHEMVDRRRAGRALAIFAAMIGAATTGLADIMVAALAAAFLLIVTGCLGSRDAYRALQGRVLMLIAGTIALGAAMEKTGAARLYAAQLVELLHHLGPTAVLGGILLVTSISTQVLSNNATAVLLIPIAISTAVGLGVNPRPFIVAVCFGASACFATPIGYQTNLLVYGPGGYRFADYLKLGIPLNLLVLVAGTVFIPRIWPF